jgi:1,2-diacylglycerol 3-alpha-glucosyltransferase
MNVVMLTNTFTPHVGGVARSVEAFAAEYRRRGHRVLVVAPDFPGMPPHEADVVRIPAVQRFNTSDFSVVLPVSGLLGRVLDAFQPGIVHAHHPYLLGMTAVRVARFRALPLVFTHHTRYEEYTHYVPGDSPALRRFVVELSTRYANLCDRVFAPSESIETMLRERGVRTPIDVVPTGVDVERFARGDGERFRAEIGIPPRAFVIGHVGRLAPEKNLGFLAEAVAECLGRVPNGHFLVAGVGPSRETILVACARSGLGERLHLAGVLEPTHLADAYDAMDVFAFASHSETQGMVLTEAMAAGVPVVALDAPGVREVVRDGENGRLLHEETRAAFASALRWVAERPSGEAQALQGAARATADRFSMARTADKALAAYEALRTGRLIARQAGIDEWTRVLCLLDAEWRIVKGVAQSARAALRGVAPAPSPGGPGSKR